MANPAGVAMFTGVSATTPHADLGALVAEAEGIPNWSADTRYWSIVDTLVDMPLPDGFGLSQQLCASDSPALRRLGAHLIAEMAVRGLRRHVQIADDAVDELLLLTSPDEDDDVLTSAIGAAGRLGGRSLRRAVLGNLRHPSPAVRTAVAIALPSLSGGADDDEVVRALIILTQDPNAVVRDFATFSLGSQTDADAPSVREALRQRLDDDDAATRDEALIGLARRADSGARDLILGRLRAGTLAEGVIDAATELADGAALPLLRARRAALGPGHPMSAALDRAIEAIGAIGASTEGGSATRAADRHPATRHRTVALPRQLR
jgi:hypothetical protein